MKPIERLGGFYLGKEVDPATGNMSPDPLMYDARDLTTHAVCVGMTGSGKTGLCIGLLEEAALDGVPAIIIDPKGDITNLLLTFPELKPADFAPWVNPDDARRKNMDISQFAAKTAQTWREGLASWDQEPGRIARLKQSAEFQIFTPGSSAGTPVSILASLRAPRQGWAGNEESLREQIRGTVSALLGLAGTDADPLRSPEHILVSTIFEHAWKQGQDLDLAGLITSIQNPPVRKIGVFDVDTFFPAKDRFALAMALNNVMAAPGFSDWLTGEPLDVGTLLGAQGGKPRHAIFCIAHLDDAQRMFFVTLLLEEVLGWVRRQGGTTSLRALLYMDEIFGFLPPSANPPSKQPMLTLLKQARAFGLGIVLATQNPVDLDYKAMSNAGTWFIGKLQTERDKARILDGLESVAGGMNRSELDKMIGGLGKRVFILHNVHEEKPLTFQTRWVMSYLRGPLTRDQIRLLKPESAVAPTATASAPGGLAQAPDLATGSPVTASAPPAAAASAPASLPDGYLSVRPSLPPKLEQVFLPVRRSAANALDALEELSGGRVDEAALRLVYRPRLLAVGRVGFVDRRRKVDAENSVKLLLEPESVGAVVCWDEGSSAEVDPNRLDPEPAEGSVFAPMIAALGKPRSLATANKDFRDWLYQEHKLEIHHLPELKLYGEVGETEEEFLGRARLAIREKRDAEVDKLSAKVQRALDRLEKKLVREQRELAEDKADYDSRKREELLSAGETLVGMLGIFGRRKRTGLSTAARKRRMTSKAKEDIQESVAEIAALEQEINDLKRQLSEDTEDVTARWEEQLDELTTYAVKPRRTDVRADLVALAWAPYWEIGPNFDRSPDRLEGWQ
jgi:hypothetical protein